MSYKFEVERGNTVKFPVGGKYCDRDIEVTATGGDGEWSPNPIWNWWDIEQIIRDDVQGSYQYKVIELISDSFPETELTGAQAYKTSDGAFYGGNATHAWNVSQDRQAYDDGGSATYKTRYIIKYYTDENIDLTIGHDCLYFVIDKAKFSNSGLGNSTLTDVKKSLLSFKLINGANLQLGVTTMSSMFRNCYSLTSVPLFDTSNVWNMSSMFRDCYSLTSVPLFDTSNVGNMSNMFYCCYSLTSVPLLDTSNVTSMVNMFRVCYSLTSVPLFNMSNATNTSDMFRDCYSLTSVLLFNMSNVTSMLNMFRNCYSLTSVPLLDTSNVTNMSDMFGNCYSLVSLKLQNLITDLTLAIAAYDTNINRDSLLYIIRNRSGTNVITLTIGATNLAKLTTEEIAEATNLYNITLA